MRSRQAVLVQEREKPKGPVRQLARGDQAPGVPGRGPGSADRRVRRPRRPWSGHRGRADRCMPAPVAAKRAVELRGSL